MTAPIRQFNTRFGTITRVDDPALILDPRERLRSGIASAKARGCVFGCRPGQRIKSDRLAPKVLALVDQGVAYRRIARELGLSKNTVTDIVKRSSQARSRAPGRLKIDRFFPFAMGTP
jgi:DNA invertase Pin-like site-specific DNA recombinase